MTLRTGKIALGVIFFGSVFWGPIAFAQQKSSTPPDPFDDPVFEKSLPPLDMQDRVPLSPIERPAEPSIEPVIDDPELAAPLITLTDSDTTPNAPGVTANADALQIRYRVTVQGLREVGLEQRFQSLSALFDRGRRADNAAQVSARANEDVKLAERLLRSEGYYDGAANAIIGPAADAIGELAVTIAATPGSRYSFGTIIITGAPDQPLEIARDALGLKAGDAIIATDVNAAEARVALALPERGYPFAVIGQRDIILDDAENRGDYTLPLDAGPKTRFGALRPAGDIVFDAGHLAVFPRFKAGTLFDSRSVDDVRQALVATSLFSTIAIEPTRTGVINADGTEQVDLIVRQVKGPWRSLSGSAGYATGEGIKLQAAWTHRNLFPPEGALTVEAVAGTREQNIGATFRRPNVGERDRALQLNVSVSRQRFDAYSANTVALGAALTRISTPLWQKRWTYSIGLETLATRESRFETALSARIRSTYFIGAMPAQLSHDRSDSLLDPTRGYRASLRLSPEIQQRTGGPFDSYVRGLIEGSAYYPVNDAMVFAGRARIGTIVGARRDSIAPSRRLYAGGGGSVRGFGYQQLSPKDANNEPIGGRSLAEFAVEARYRFGDFGVVAFADGGRVGASASPAFTGMRYGAGLGARYYTNFGPLRIDVATPMNRQPGEPVVALYLSIGQAF
jgi:translocation and assembly module TamA